MARKTITIRISEDLYKELAAWAENDFRSVNGQMEYLLTECVRQHRKSGRYVPEKPDIPNEIELDLDSDA